VNALVEERDAGLALERRNQLEAHLRNQPGKLRCGVTVVVIAISW
jgi:hypothetical protein